MSTLRIFWSALHTSPDTGSVVKPFLYINTAPLSQIPSPTTRQLVNISPNPPGSVAQVVHLQLPKMPSRSFHSINNAILSHPASHLPPGRLAAKPLPDTAGSRNTTCTSLYPTGGYFFLVHVGIILFLSVNSPPLICNMYCHLFPQIATLSQTDLLVSYSGNICLTNLGFAAIIALGKFLGWVFEL